MLDRDAADSAVSSFLTASEGVATLDTSELSFEDSVAAVLALVASRPTAPVGTAAEDDEAEDAVRALDAMLAAHPYEEPAWHAYRALSREDLAR